MEEPPQIQQILSSQGISLSDTVATLETYLSYIERSQYYGVGGAAAGEDDARASFDDNSNDQDGMHHHHHQRDRITTKDGMLGKSRKSRQEREEEELLAQMDQFTNIQYASSASTRGGRMISDDIYERLKLITQSIRAEVEGNPLSAITTRNDNNNDDDNQNEDKAATMEKEMFLAELGEAEQIHQEYQHHEEQHQQQHQQLAIQSKKDKKKAKKEKKAKKAAKKAKKEARRKSVESMTL